MRLQSSYYVPYCSNVVAAAVLTGAELGATGENLTPGAAAIVLSRGPVVGINEIIF